MSLNRTSRTGCLARYYVTILVMIVLVTLSGLSQGIAGALSVAILLLLFPTVSWIFAARLRPATRILRLYLQFWRRINKGYYFETSPKRVHGIERRTVELVLPVMGISAYFSERLTSVSLERSLALVIFLGVAIVVLSLSSLFLIAIWVYEDSGFRAHSIGSTTLGIPLSVLKGALVYGGLGAYLSFSWGLTGSVGGGLGFTIALLFFVGPSCYLISTLFDDRIARKAIDEVRSIGTSKGIPVKSMNIT